MSDEVVYYDHRFREHIAQLAQMIPIEPGDVVQITAPHQWPGAFAVVEEVADWGVKANMPVARGKQVFDSPLRLANGEFVRVGIAIK